MATRDPHIFLPPRGDQLLNDDATASTGSQILRTSGMPTATSKAPSPTALPISGTAAVTSVEPASVGEHTQQSTLLHTKPPMPATAAPVLGTTAGSSAEPVLRTTAGSSAEPATVNEATKQSTLLPTKHPSEKKRQEVAQTSAHPATTAELTQQPTQVPTISNHSRPIQVSNESHHLSNPSFNYTNASFCKSVNDSAPTIGNLYQRSWPLLCDESSYGDISLRGVICYPFWQYGAMEMLVWFTGLLWCRQCSRKRAKNWKKKRFQDEREGTMKEQKKNDDAGIKDKVEVMDANAQKLVEPFLPEAAGAVPMEMRSLPAERGETWCMYGLKGCCHCGKKWGQLIASFTFRLLVQIFQWWVVMIVLLLGMLRIEFIRLVTQFQLGEISWLGFISMRSEVPEAFKGQPDWLVWFSVYSIQYPIYPIYLLSVVMILLQVITHISGVLFGIEYRLKYLRAIKDGAITMSIGRDVAIQVLLLPMVYGFLSLRSLGCMWQSLSGTIPPPLQCHHWNATGLVPRSLSSSRSVLSDVYDSNLSLADLYESWALFQFASMVARVLKPELKKKIKPDVIKAFEGLITTDVLVFVVIVALSAVNRIGLTWTKWRLGTDMCEVCPVLCIFSPYLIGANWCVSSIAIYNLIVIEKRFHGLESMKRFNPLPKFLAIKLMIMVSFWLDLLMVPLRLWLTLDENQSKLLDSSIRLWTMAVVACGNMYAWWPCNLFKETWYVSVDRDWTDNMKAERGGEQEGPMNNVGVSQVPRGTIDLIQELLRDKISESQAQHYQQMSGCIDKLSDEQLDLVFYRGSQIGWTVPSQFAQRELSSSVLPAGRSDNKQALFHRSADERKDVLKAHLKGFYPDDHPFF